MPLKYFIAFTGIFFLVASPLFAKKYSSSGPSKVSLTIVFPKLDTPRGKILLRIQNRSKDTVHQKFIPVRSDRESHTCQLQPGSYAVAAFHDINSNAKLDRQWSGFPAEPYGFSNNVRGTLGPPSLKDQLIELTSDRQISIRLR